MKSSLWECKDGRVMRIVDMSTDHILNSMRMLERMHQEMICSIGFPCFQGEMAQMYAEQEFDQLMDSSVEDVYPAYKKLRKELLKRKKKGIKQ